MKDVAALTKQTKDRQRLKAILIRVILWVQNIGASLHKVYLNFAVMDNGKSFRPAKSGEVAQSLTNQ
jgi:hypothetical protein